MGGAVEHLLQQRRVQPWLPFPHIEKGQRPVAARQTPAQGLVIDHRAPAGIDQRLLVVERPQPGLVQQMPGGLVAAFDQRHMQGDGVRRQRLVQRHRGHPAGARQRRVAPQHLHIQRAQPGRHQAAHIAETDHAHGAAPQRAPVVLAGHQQRLQHVFRHRPGIAAGRAGKGDAQPVQGVQIHMVGADGGGPHEPHRCIGQQGFRDRRHRAHQQDVRVAQVGPRQTSPVHAGHPPQALKVIQGGHVFVGDDVHRLSQSRSKAVALSATAPA